MLRNYNPVYYIGNLVTPSIHCGTIIIIIIWFWFYYDAYFPFPVYKCSIVSKIMLELRSWCIGRGRFLIFVVSFLNKYDKKKINMNMTNCGNNGFIFIVIRSIIIVKTWYFHRILTDGPWTNSGHFDLSISYPNLIYSDKLSCIFSVFMVSCGFCTMFIISRA